VQWLAGRSADAQESWRAGADHALAAGDEFGRGDALSWIVSALMFGPTPVPTAIARSEEILDQLQADRYLTALAMRPIANLHAMAGQFDVATDLLERSKAIVADLGVRMLSAVAHFEATIALLAEDFATAEAVLRTGYEQLEAMGERALLATTAALLAKVVLAQGGDDEAWRILDAGEAAAAADDLSAHMLSRGVRARLLARRGELPAALRLSEEAVALAAQTDWLMDHGDALMARAEVLDAGGDRAGALATVRDALARYERKGCAPSAERAHALIHAWT